jgi:hypothetical protein
MIGFISTSVAFILQDVGIAMVSAREHALCVSKFLLGKSVQSCALTLAERRIGHRLSKNAKSVVINSGQSKGWLLSFALMPAKFRRKPSTLLTGSRHRCARMLLCGQTDESVISFSPVRLIVQRPVKNAGAAVRQKGHITTILSPSGSGGCAVPAMSNGTKRSQRVEPLVNPANGVLESTGETYNSKMTV